MESTQKEKPLPSDMHDIATHGDKDDAVSTTDQLKNQGEIDTVHNDEATKVLATYRGDLSWEPGEERRVRTKIDKRLLPIMCVTYGLQYYDRTMISQAVSLGPTTRRPNLQLG